MAETGTRCLHAQVGAIQADADGADEGEVRSQLTSRLRCASLLDCAEAVSCSDHSMTLLRQLVLKREHS